MFKSNGEFLKMDKSIVIYDFEQFLTDFSEQELENTPREQIFSINRQPFVLIKE